MELLAELHREGAPEASLMETYLDWRLPDWCDDAQASAAEPAGARRRSRATAALMSAEEAYAVLGIGSDASEEEIRQAHRKLMMKMTPTRDRPTCGAHQRG
jgi:DnaJ-domain-containing protein 1